MKRKELIREKVTELGKKYDEYDLLCDQLCRGDDYEFYQSISYEYLKDKRLTLYGMVCFAIVSIIVSVVFQIYTLCLCFIAGLVGAFCFSIWRDNNNARKDIARGFPGTITICFYTQKLLDEICAQITTVEDAIAKAERKIEERRAAAAEELREREEAALREAEKVHLKFEAIFKIIREELRGEVQDYELSDGEVYIKLPILYDTHLGFDWWPFALTEDGWENLIYRVSRLRPIMAGYHSLQKLLDTAVPAEQ